MSEAVTVDVHLERDSVQQSFAEEICEGLSVDPPWISSNNFTARPSSATVRR